jgi:hypothetical protein
MIVPDCGSVWTESVEKEGVWLILANGDRSGVWLVAVVVDGEEGEPPPLVVVVVVVEDSAAATDLSGDGRGEPDPRLESLNTLLFTGDICEPGTSFLYSPVVAVVELALREPVDPEMPPKDRLRNLITALFTTTRILTVCSTIMARIKCARYGVTRRPTLLYPSSKAENCFILKR